MRLFDTHAHLQGREFDGERVAVLQRAWDAGLVGLLVLGVDVASSEAAIALAEAQAGVLAAAGCHPHEADGMDDASLERLAQLAQHPRVAAVGEIGLDFYRNFSGRAAQLDVFRRQLEVAAEVAKPVAVHCREAQAEMFPIIESWSRRLGGRLPDGRPLGVMHYFSGDPELAHRYIDLGLLISIHTSVTHPNKEPLREVARRLTLDALVVETDSPYGPPQAHRKERHNQPAYVAEAVKTIAEARGEAAGLVAEATTENALRLLAPAPQAAADGLTPRFQEAERSARCA